MKDKKINRYITTAILLFLFIMLCGSYHNYLPAVTAKASEVSPTPLGTKVNASINYITGILTVSAGPGGSDRFYFSLDKKKTWELIETTGTINNTYAIDIRGIMKSSDLSIFLKGNKDKEPLEFVIPAEDKSLKVKYGVNNGNGYISYELPTGRVLEYRVNAEGSWVDYPSTGLTLQIYEVSGATLQFRLKATQTARAGKIVVLKIPKRAKAPTVKVDGSKLTFTGLKSGAIQYRVVERSGSIISISEAKWVPFAPSDSKVKELNIISLAIISTVPQNTRIPSVTVEFRSIATDKSPASAIRTIELEAQREAPTLAAITLVGTTLTINDASSKNPYEILVLHKGEVPNLITDKWKSVTNSNQQIIKKAGKADIIPSDVIYIRYKAGKDNVTGIETMASRYISIEVTSLTNTTK